MIQELEAQKILDLYKLCYAPSEHLGFAPYMGLEKAQYALYPLSNCKEYPLDAYQSAYMEDNTPLEQTGYFISLNSDKYIEDIQKTIHSIEQLFRFKKSEFLWIKNAGVLLVLGSKSWHSTPAMLSLYMALARISVRDGAIDFSLPLEEITNKVSEYGDGQIFRYKTWGDFVKLVRSRKIKHNPKYFEGRYIHSNGIRSFLTEAENLENPASFFSRTRIF